MYSKSKTILINSKNRVSGTNSNFMFKISELVDEKLDSVICSQCLIPKSYYLIQTGINDTFTLTESGSSATVTLSAGNYTLNSLKTNLVSKLNIASPHSYTYAITYPSSTQVDTGKLTFTVSGNGSVQPSFTFSSTSCYEILGFAINSTNTFVSSSLTSTNVIKLQKEDCIRIMSDLVDDGSLCNIFSAQDLSFSSIVYKAIDVLPQSKKIRNRGNNIYSFSLTNEDGQPIDTNGQNIVIELLVFKDYNIGFINTSRMLQGFIKYSLIDNFPEISPNINDDNENNNVG